MTVKQLSEFTYEHHNLGEMHGHALLGVYIGSEDAKEVMREIRATTELRDVGIVDLSTFLDTGPSFRYMGVNFYELKIKRHLSALHNVRLPKA